MKRSLPSKVEIKQFALPLEKGWGGKRVPEVALFITYCTFDYF